MNSNGFCVLDPECRGYKPHLPPNPCNGTWSDTNGYRRVPGDTCDITTGVNLLPTIRACSLPVPLPAPFFPIIIVEDNTSSQLKYIVIFAVIFLFIFIGVGVILSYLAKTNTKVYNLLAKLFPASLLPTPKVVFEGLEEEEDNILNDADDAIL